MVIIHLKKYECFSLLTNRYIKLIFISENLVNILTDGVLQNNKFKTYYNSTPHPEQYKQLEGVYEFNTILMLYVLIEHTNFLSIGKPPGHKTTMKPSLLIHLKKALLKLRYITNVTGYAVYNIFHQNSTNSNI